MLSALIDSPLPPLAEFLHEQGVCPKDLRRALEAWTDEAEATIHHLDSFTDPHTYLAASDQLQAVQVFRELL